MTAVRAAAEMFSGAMARLGTQAKLAEMEGELAAFAAANAHTALVPLPAMGPGGASMIMHFECCDRKAPFTNTVKSAHELYARMFDEYGKRARMAETNVGVDWKALSHAVRVGREAIELLGTGKITFPLPYAARILAIKQGAVPYDEVADEIERLLEEVEAAAASSALPERPDFAFIGDLVARAYRDAVCGG